MPEVVTEVLGPELPYPRCSAALYTVNKVVNRLGVRGRVEVVKKDINSDDVLDKYGVLISPAIAVNGEVKFQGRVPSEKELEKLLRSFLSRDVQG